MAKYETVSQAVADVAMANGIVWDARSFLGDFHALQDAVMAMYNQAVDMRTGKAIGYEYGDRLYERAYSQAIDCSGCDEALAATIAYQLYREYIAGNIAADLPCEQTKGWQATVRIAQTNAWKIGRTKRHVATA